MKKMSTLFFLLTLVPSLAGATSIVFNDPYGAGNAAYPFNSTLPGADVIGERQLFDLKSVALDFGGTSFKATLQFNYKAGGLTSFKDGSGANQITLRPADLLFNVAGDSTYGIAVATHKASAYNNHGASVQAGYLYKTLDSEIIDAHDALGNKSGWIYRNEADVWLNPKKSTEVNTGNRTLTVSTSPVPVNDGGPGGSLYTVVIGFEGVPAEFINALYGSHMTFASATCGNDVIEGTLPNAPAPAPAPVPEPGTMMLLGSGLVGLAGIGLRRFRK